ncbi:MAG: DUF6398 domain-containing protein [Solirubrobacteraceae bacterium]
MRVPKALRPKFEEICAFTDRFCAERLDAEYAELCRKLVGRLARKRPSPLERGDPRIWAAGTGRRRGRSRARGGGDPAESLAALSVECGGELYFAVDFTPAGFPIGLRPEELDAAMGGSVSDPRQSPAPRGGWSRDPL